ncbi:WxL domain-containing protein [Weissella confusa]|uniref:WxL domain-containing protein n=1 Tax=Weissella confusa TaxID=1583 RepID=UPI0021C1B736|nr:WxL domain-containing protein [Weissella confusa]MCT8392603.1 WxL domain-containing protein [Weissella confusa]
MKKQFTLFAASTLAAMTFVPMVGFAAETTPAGPITYDSKGTVEFVAPTTPNKPLDPTNPDPNKPLDPKNPDGTPSNPGTSGPLTLDFASSFDFGKQEITSVDQTYNASAQRLGDGKYVPDYAQITDNRGTFAGWTLSVKETDAFHTSGNVDLKATQIKFMDLNHATTNTLKTDVSMPKDFTLNPAGASVNIMSGAKADANKTNGTSGTHIIRFGNDNSLKTDDTQANGEKRDNTVDPSVTLIVPGASDKMAQKYTTTLQWTLGETPTDIK